MDAPINLNENYYYTEGDAHNPTILLDKKQNKYEFSGNSQPEDAITFYIPIIEWFKLYKKNPNKKAIVIFNLNYINSATSKMIHKIIQKLNEIYLKGINIEVEWHYHIGDEDMLLDGKTFLEDMSLPYKFINCSFK